MSIARELELDLPDLPLERGGVVTWHRAHAWVSEPAQADASTVLVVHALTGNARADEWWGPVIGPGLAIDTDRYRVVCFNNLGSCYGSSGPGVPGFPESARLTTLDQARAIWLALDQLNIGRLHLVAGGSLGGMIILAMAALRPGAIERLLPIGACASSSAWVVGFNHVQRQIIALDPTRGLEVARQLAMLTYRAEPGLERRQSRHDPLQAGAPGDYRVQGYLEHLGVSLRKRFTTASYLALLDAMDSHDVERGLAKVKAPALVVDLDTDVLFTPAQSDRLAELLPNATRATIRSEHGHDAFLIEWPQVAEVLQRALALPAENHHDADLEVRRHIAGYARSPHAGAGSHSR